MYTTVLGDTWDIISKKFYGSEKYVNTLLQANTANISKVVFSAGIQLVIPEIQIETINSSLPPWRQ